MFLGQRQSYEVYDSILDFSTREDPSYLSFPCFVALKISVFPIHFSEVMQNENDQFPTNVQKFGKDL